MSQNEKDSKNPYIFPAATGHASTGKDVRHKTVLVLNGPPNCGKDTAAAYLVKEHGYTQLEMKGALRKIAHKIAAIHDFDALDRLPQPLQELTQEAELIAAANYNRVLAMQHCNEIEYSTCKADKDTIRSGVFGLDGKTGMFRTWREFLIHVSEDICKPLFGNDIFARAALLAIQECDNDKIVFSDGGFQIEFDLMSYSDRKLNVRLIRMYRNGTTFDGDSRNYIEDVFGFDDMGIDLYNDQSIEHLQIRLDKIVAEVTS